MNKNKNNFLSFVLRLGFSVLLLGYLFSTLDLKKIQSVILSADVYYLFFALTAYCISNLFTLIRWVVFIRALELMCPLWDAVRYYFIGLFGNLFLPTAIGGDVIKIIGLCQTSNQKPRVVASVLLDRLAGFAAISIIAVTVFVFGYNIIPEKKLAVHVGILAAGSLIVGAFLFNEKIYSFGCSFFSRMPKFKDALMQMHYDIALLKNKKMDAVKAVLLSCCAQISFAVSFYFVGKALGLQTGLIYFLIFVPLICVASALPSIGGLGVREAGAAYLFGQIGVPSEISVSISFMIFIFMVLTGILGGLIYVFTVSSGRLQHYSPNAGSSL